MAIPTFAVKGVILNEEGKFLFLQRNGKTRDKSNWDLPGGLVEQGEEEKLALAREIKEELNLDVEITEKGGEWQFYRPLDGNQVKVQNYFCKIKQGEIKLSDEHESYKWVSIENIRDYPVKDNSLYEAIKKSLKQ